MEYIQDLIHITESKSQFQTTTAQTIRFYAFMPDQCISRVACVKNALPILPTKTPIIGDKHAFKEHRHRTEYPAFDVMRQLLYWAWIAKKPHAVEFCHTLVCCADGESSLFPKESIDCFYQHSRWICPLTVSNHWQTGVINGKTDTLIRIMGRGGSCNA